MHKLLRRAGILGSLLALAAVAALGGQASAAPQSPSGAAAKAARTATATTAAGGRRVVASGLDNPRGIAFGQDGALYVAEAGAGGSGPCATGPDGEICFGPSGAVTRIWRGTQQRVLTGLPSVAQAGGSFALGPSDVSLTGARQYVLVNGPFGGPQTRQQFGPGAEAFGRLLRVTGHTVRFVADFPTFEAANNPDNGAGAQPGLEIDSDPNGLLARPGVRVVADAGGNDLLKVDAKGRISVLAVFPVRLVSAPPGIPGLPPQIPMQSVPTTVVVGPDGAYYVGELTGFPFPVGRARVYRVVPGHRPQVYARGFTNIIDIAFDGRGRLHVLEIAKNGLLSGDLTGALIRVNKDGSRRTLASNGLVAPAGFVIAADGGIYVTNNGVFADIGQVARIPPH
jgi:hypothetical protein